MNDQLIAKIELVYSFLWNEFRGRAVEFTDFTVEFNRYMSQSLAIFLDDGAGGKPISMLREYEDKYFIFVRTETVVSDDGKTIAPQWMICPARTVPGMPHGGLVRLNPEQQKVLVTKLPAKDQLWKLAQVDFQVLAQEFQIDRFSVMAAALFILGYERRSRPDYPVVYTLPEYSGKEFMGICADGLIKYVRVINNDVLPNVNLQVEGLTSSIDGCFVFGRFIGKEGSVELTTEEKRINILKWNDLIESEYFPDFEKWLVDDNRTDGLWPCCKTTTRHAAIFYHGYVYQGFTFNIANGRLEPGQIVRSVQRYESVDQLMNEQDGLEITIGSDECRFITPMEDVTQVVFKDIKGEMKIMNERKYSFFERLADMLCLGKKYVYVENCADTFLRLGNSLKRLLQRDMSEEDGVSADDVNGWMDNFCNCWEQAWKPIANGDYSRVQVFNEQEDRSLKAKAVKLGAALSSCLPAVFLLKCEGLSVKVGGKNREVYLRIKLEAIPKSTKKQYAKYSYKVDVDELIFADSWGNSLSGVFDIPLYIPNRDKMWHQVVELANDKVDEAEFNQKLVCAWWNCRDKNAEQIVLDSGIMVGDVEALTAQPIEVRLSCVPSFDGRPSYSYEVALGESEYDRHCVDIPTVEEYSELTWDDKDHKPKIIDTDKYTVSYSTLAPWIDVGTYCATIKLRTDKHFWADGSSGDKKIEVKILKAANAWKISPTVEARWNERGVWSATVYGKPDHGTMVVTYDADKHDTMPTSLGEHEAHFHVEETSNYAGIDFHLCFKVTPKPTVEKCDEKDFLERFIRYAITICGFKYQIRDLIRFHTSVKCGLLTLLGGEPGCGKSSLVKLYSRALAGASWPQKIDHDNNLDDTSCPYLQVDVNPAWTEPGDLIGFLLPKEESGQSFLPANNGLFSFLKNADQNFQSEDRKMFVVAYEEMNLARVELYFSEFMQLISNEDRRSLSNGYKLTSQDKQVSINDNIRFVGTFNEDWTVQKFSSRFLDRCNVIRLSIKNEDVMFGATRGKLMEWPDEALAVDANSFKDWSNGSERMEDEADFANDVFSKLQKGRLEEKEDAKVDILTELHLLPSLRVRGEILRYMQLRPSFDWDKERERLIPIDKKERLKCALDEALLQRLLSKCEPSSEPRIVASLEKLRTRLEVLGEDSLSVKRTEELLEASKEMSKWGSGFLD